MVTHLENEMLIKTLQYVTKQLSFKSPQIWSVVISDIENAGTLVIFKQKKR